LSAAVLKQVAVFLLVAVIVAIAIATLKIKENYDSILTDQAINALVQFDNETCVPFLRLGQNAPDFIKQQRLKKYENDNTTCYIKTKDNLFDNNRNPETACTRENPQLYTSTHSNLIESISPGFVVDEKNGEFGADNVCLIKFNPNALAKSDATQKLHEYASYVSSRDPTVFRLTSDNTSLQTKITSLERQNNTENRLSGFSPNNMINVASLWHKCIDGGWNENQQAYLWDCAGVGSQRWNMDNKNRLVINRDKNLCLGPQGNIVNNGTPLITKICNDEDNMKWFYDKETKEIKNHANPGMCIDVPNWKFNNGQGLTTWHCHGGTNQQWGMRQ
jgi:hypothetical protein